MKEIKLAGATIEKEELNNLNDWIASGAQLTKGPLTALFEEKFSEYIGCRHSVFVNSGSSANLLIIYSLHEGGYLKNNKVIVPAISWITTLSPVIQLGLEPILCEANEEDIGLDLNHFEALCKKHNPGMAIIVHVLGHPNKMEEINSICARYNVVLVEDSCEALGTIYKNKKLGSLGSAGSFSFYYGHHISTIEGGMVTTDDNKLYNTMLSIRSHGWARDIEHQYKIDWSKNFDVDEFRFYYTFYYPGFNLRSTDLNAFLGLAQLKKIEKITEKREENFDFYARELSKVFWRQKSERTRLSSFAYGTFVKNRLEVFKYLKANKIETRPLICGSMGRQPFWIKKYGVANLPFADIVHDFGIYLPNHCDIGEPEIKYISDKFKEVAVPLNPKDLL